MATYKTAIKSTPVTKLTENGMASYASSLNAHVDLFYQLGALRRFPERAVDFFAKAYRADAILATKLALHGRDVRGGAGERNSFREILKWLERSGEFGMIKEIVPHIPTFGRWDDLLVFEQPETRIKFSYPVIERALHAGDGLCAKWMPRKGAIAGELRKFLKLTPKQYRKTLVALTKVVETQMCAKQWDDINFEHVPSVAMKGYQKAFGRHCGERWMQYKDALAAGTAGVHAGALYPYDCFTAMKYGERAVAAAQWEALPNYLGDNKILPVVDTSGSMTWFKVTDNLTGADVALSLGLYCATKQTGAFKDVVFTFNTTPEAFVLNGSIEEKYMQIYSMGVGGSTNIEACFKLMLNIAKRNSVPAEEMPAYIVIFSDMQFNACVREPDETSYEMMTRMFAEAGYALPKVVYWNLDGRNADFPVTFSQQGTALVSGFATAIMTAILNGSEFTPVGIMMEAIGTERYNIFGAGASSQDGEAANQAYLRAQQAYKAAMKLV